MTIRNIALIVLCLASAPAFAGGVTVAQLNDASINISKITLDESGLLTVVPRGVAKEATLQISEGNLEDIISTVRVLSRETIVTDHRAAVCMIAVGIGGYRELAVGQFDQSTGRFVGSDTHVVLTSSGCWNANYTHPYDVYAVNDARELETVLLTLANEAIK